MSSHGRSLGAMTKRQPMQQPRHDNTVHADEGPHYLSDGPLEGPQFCWQVVPPIQVHEVPPATSPFDEVDAGVVQPKRD